MISKFVWAAIGGLITSVLIPFTTYFVIRFITKSGIRIIIRDNEQDGYKTIRLILKNNSKTSLRNVVTFVSINNDKNDIISDFKNIFCKHGPVEYCLTSWAKNVDNKNYPNIDINQGECPDLNLIRYHSNYTEPCIEIASEQGFSDKHSDPTSASRIVLKANHNYSIEVTFTGDNFFPIKKRYVFKNSEKQLIES